MSRRDPPWLPRAARLGLLLRGIGAAAALALALWLAISRSDDDFATSLANAYGVAPRTSLLAFALAFALFGANFAAGAARFRTLLRSAGIERGFGPVLRALVVASFFNTFLPGAVMGDAYRVVEVRQRGHDGAAALGLVLLERLLGLSALGLFVVAASPFLPWADLARAAGERAGAGAGISPLAVLTGVVALALVATLAPLPLLHRAVTTRLGRRLPATGRFGPRARRSLDALAAVGRTRIVAGAFAWSLVCQALPVLAVWVLAWPLATTSGDGPAFTWFAIIVPVVTLLGMVPISIGGAGIRELAYVVLFGQAGVAPGAAFGLSLATFAVAVAWAALGLALFVLGRRPAEHAAAEPAAETLES